jgi:hypothetical protein
MSSAVRKPSDAAIGASYAKFGARRQTRARQPLACSRVQAG